MCLILKIFLASRFGILKLVYNYINYDIGVVNPSILSPLFLFLGLYK